VSRLALVTGAARGIGAAIAARLLADGLDVVTADREEGCDLRFDVARGTLPELDDVDVCVSNAAITDTVAPAHEMSPDQWARDIEVNLSGAFRVVQVRAMPADILERLDSALPAGRMAAPREIAALVAFLASEDAGSLTGEAIGAMAGCR
jgi:NAD(P)-dependent dehydrogenase (short-subunit alcohol dehydrogenase family)